MELKEVADKFEKAHGELKGFIDRANAEIEQNKTVSTETKSAVERCGTEVKELADRLGKLEAKSSRTEERERAEESVGARFTKSDQFKALAEGKTGKARLEMKAITNTLPPSNDAPLTVAQRIAGIIANPNRTLRIRDLLPVGRTSGNLVEYTKENVFTNSAGPQAGQSPTVQAEGVVKNESDITFTLASAPVATLAHFIVASKQVLADAPMLQSYIENRLTYGLKLVEESQLLNGDGAFGNLSGLRSNQTAYNRHVAGDTRIDTLRRAITQLQTAEMDCEVFILNPQDWEKIELQKDSTNSYLLANPQSIAGPTLWGRPVVSTNSMPVNNFSAFNLTLAAQLWDREQAAVTVSTEDDQNFRKNLVTILAEERLALTVYRAAALIGSQFPQS